MMNLSQYFDAAYVINLPKRTDRLKSFKREFARVGWPLGSDGIQVFSAFSFTDPGGFSSSNSRGCYHSHFECIRLAHLQGRRNVLVMEDDIALASSIRRVTEMLIAQLEAKLWDLLYLGHERSGNIERADAGTTSVKLVPANVDFIGAHFYAVNSGVFVRLLEHLDKISSGKHPEFGPMPIDGAFNQFRRKYRDINAFLADPKLGWQRPSRSDNHPRFFDQLKPLRPVMTAFRNVKYAVERWRTE